jgi:hypothetical protein
MLTFPSSWPRGPTVKGEGRAYMLRNNTRYPIIFGGIIIFLAVLTVVVLRMRSRTIIDVIATRDIAKLEDIFTHINSECHILGFDKQDSRIDFLTAKNPVGSKVGSMTLRIPERWDGPYLQKSLILQGKFYQVVKTDKGYFVAPGDGVRLSNGQTIGRDIVLNKSADISALIHSKVLQDKKGQALAARIPVSN